MNLQDIKTQLDALNKVVSEMETAKAETAYTFTQEQMEKFVSHMASTLVEAIKSQIDNKFEVNEDSIETEVSSNYDRSFEISLEIDQREIKRNIKDIIKCSYDESGVMEEVMNCYPAIVEPVAIDPIPFQD